MENAKDMFKKEKLVAFLTVASVTVLCIQHFWGIWADASKIQVSYVPLIITFTTIAINEVGSSYEHRKKIVTTVSIAAIVLCLCGVSMLAISGYGIVIDNDKVEKYIYIFITIITLIIDIFEIEKWIRI